MDGLSDFVMQSSNKNASIGRSEGRKKKTTLKRIQISLQPSRRNKDKNAKKDFIKNFIFVALSKLKEIKVFLFSNVYKKS